jgi:hypothetical protein
VHVKHGVLDEGEVDGGIIDRQGRAEQDLGLAPGQELLSIHMNAQRQRVALVEGERRVGVPR